MISSSICAADQLEPAIESPTAEISGGEITAKIHLPDAEKGFYRGTRFDWAGAIFDLRYKGHRYFGKWFDKYHPETHDAICGPVDEFMAIGYDEASVNGTFLRIGIGLLKKPSNKEHDRFGFYEIVDPGQWEVNTEKDGIRFVHVLENDHYSYIYVKAIKLSKDKPQMTIHYSLKNTGKKPLKTEVYNHNFFTIDGTPTGPDIVVRFPFHATGDWQKPNGPAVLKDGEVTYKRTFEKGESVFIGNLGGFDDRIEHNGFTLENRATKAAVRVAGNQPLTKVIFWASPTTSCVEPYTAVDVESGKVFNWTNVYDFYEKH